MKKLVLVFFFLSSFLTVAQDAYTKEIMKYFKENGSKIDIEFIVKNGIQKFSTSYPYEVIYVNFSINIDFHDGKHTPYLYSSSGETFFQIQALDVNLEDVEKLYLKAIEASIHKCFTKIQELIEKG